MSALVCRLLLVGSDDMRQSESLIVVVNDGQYRLKANEIKYAVDENPSIFLSILLAGQVHVLYMYMYSPSCQFPSR